MEAINIGEATRERVARVVKEGAENSLLQRPLTSGLLGWPKIGSRGGESLWCMDRIRKYGYSCTEMCGLE